MDDALTHVAVEPGHNVVARFGNAAGVFSTRNAADAGRVEQLIDALEAASDASANPGEDFTRRVAPLIIADGPAWPPFAVVAAVPNGVVVSVHGSAWARVTTPDTTMNLAGDSELAWVARIVKAPISEIALTLSADGQKPTDLRSNLRLGSVSGDGLVIRFAGASVSPVAPIAPAAPVLAFAPAVHIDEPPTSPTPVVADVPEEDSPALPEAIDPTVAAASSADDVETHQSAVVLDDQTDDGSTQDGLPVDSGATQMAPVASPSPVLIGDDGSRIILDRNYVLGRDPRSDSAVRRGEASPITIPDVSSAVSRVHAYLTATRGKVTVRDNHSTNGTYVASPGAPEWSRLNGEAVQLQTGWAMCLGNRIYVLHDA